MSRDLGKTCTALGTALHKDAESLCGYGLAIAELGGGVALLSSLSGETSARSVVVVVCGSIPDDLVDSLRNYALGLIQDLETSGKIRN